MKKSESSETLLDVKELTSDMDELLKTGVNQSLAWRIQQLQTVMIMVKDHWDDWAKALGTDMGKKHIEAVGTELLMVMSDLKVCLGGVKDWIKKKHVKSPGVCWPCFSTIEPRPLGKVLVIGPSNYPVSLVIQPMLGALAAGNCVVIKPSELCPAVCQLFTEVIPKYFDGSIVQCVTGGIPETSALLSVPWGKIFFTGSPAVGKIVAKAAANTLTPVVLELGGKCPTYVDEHHPSDVTQIANRIIFSKTLNSGQTCAATDTLILHEAARPKMVRALMAAVKRQFGENPKVSGLGRIVSQKHAERHVKLLEEIEEDDKDKCIVGGSKCCDVATKYIAPTLVLRPAADSRLMKEEIFGPILPILVVKSRQEAMEEIRKLPGTPLCMYVFTSSDQVFDEMSRALPAGSVVRNDCLVHLASPYLPFGGLGTSGYGVYHGKYSFDTFCHHLPVMNRLSFPGADLCWARYHPFGQVKSVLVKTLLLQIPAVPVLRYHVQWLAIGIGILFGIPKLLSVLPVEVANSLSSLLQPILEPFCILLETAAQQLRASYQI